MPLGVTDRELEEFKAKVRAAVESVEYIDVESFEVESITSGYPYDVCSVYLSGDMDYFFEFYNELDPEISQQLIYDNEQQRIRWLGSVDMPEMAQFNIPDEEQRATELFIQGDLAEYIGETPDVHIEFTSEYIDVYAGSEEVLCDLEDWLRKADLRVSGSGLSDAGPESKPYKARYIAINGGPTIGRTRIHCLRKEMSKRGYLSCPQCSGDMGVNIKYTFRCLSCMTMISHPKDPRQIEDQFEPTSDSFDELVEAYESIGHEAMESPKTRNKLDLSKADIWGQSDQITVYNLPEDFSETEGISEVFVVGEKDQPVFLYDLVEHEFRDESDVRCYLYDNEITCSVCEELLENVSESGEGHSMIVGLYSEKYGYDITNIIICTECREEKKTEILGCIRKDSPVKVALNFL